MINTKMNDPAILAAAGLSAVEVARFQLRSIAPVMSNFRAIRLPENNRFVRR